VQSWRVYGKNGVRGTKDYMGRVGSGVLKTLETWYKTWHDICVGVYWNSVVPGWKLSHWTHDKGECLAVRDGRLRTFWRKRWSLLCLLLHVHIHLLVWCSDSLHLMLKISGLSHQGYIFDAISSHSLWLSAWNAFGI